MSLYTARFICLLGLILGPNLAKGSITYEIYIESWKFQACTGPNSCASAWPTCKFAWNDLTICNIAFASFQYNTGNPNAGLFFGIAPMTLTALHATRDLIHSQGGKIKMSYGGASGNYQYWNIPGWDTDSVLTAVADNITSACVGNNLDGVDFDFEGRPPSGSGAAVARLIKAIRNIFNVTGNSDKLLTLTIPTQALQLTPLPPGQQGRYPEFDALLQGLMNPDTGQIDYVDHINFMEYCCVIAPGNTLASQATSDIEGYHQSIVYHIPYNKMGLGMEQLCCNPAHCAAGESPENPNTANTLTTWANDTGLAGVFWWDLNTEVDYHTPNLCTMPGQIGNAFPVSYAIRFACGQPAQPLAHFAIFRGKPTTGIGTTAPPLGFDTEGRENAVIGEGDDPDSPTPP